MTEISRISQGTADFIMPGARENRRKALIPLLEVRPERSPNPSRSEIEGQPQPPEGGSDTRFNYSYDELVNITNTLTPGTPGDLSRVLRYGLVWSGMKVDDALLHWTTLDHGYKPGTRLSRVTLPVDNKRLSVRVVPDAWEDRYDTPFRLQRGNNGVQISAADGRGGQVEIARPTTRYITESVLNLAYGIAQSDGSQNITINPLQKCPQNCEFCCRGYHDMTLERKNELINLSPGEMARALPIKFPNVEDWRSVSGITLVTGDFRKDTDILDYMEGFVAAMSDVTSGEWNPLTNPHQDISVSTHLIQSRASMERAKELGMKRFLHTVEMVDDSTREKVMHLGRKEFTPSTLNKGHTSFSDILGTLETAIEVFGANNVEPVLVVGLDPLDTTKQAMDRLKGIGITRVSRALLNVYDQNQFGLLPEPFESAVAGMQYARDLFGSPHSRVVSENDSFHRQELSP